MIVAQRYPIKSKQIPLRIGRETLTIPVSLSAAFTDSLSTLPLLRMTRDKLFDSTIEIYMHNVKCYSGTAETAIPTEGCVHTATFYCCHSHFLFVNTFNYDLYQATVYKLHKLST